MKVFPPDLSVRPSRQCPGKWVIQNDHTGHGVVSPFPLPVNRAVDKSFFDSEEAASAAIAEWREAAAEAAAVKTATPPRPVASRGWKRGRFHPALAGRERGKDEEGNDVLGLDAWRHPAAPGLVVHRGVNGGGWGVSHDLSGLLCTVFPNRWENKIEAQRYALGIAPLADWTASVVISRGLYEECRIVTNAIRNGPFPLGDKIP